MSGQDRCAGDRAVVARRVVDRDDGAGRPGEDAALDAGAAGRIPPPPATAGARHAGWDGVAGLREQRDCAVRRDAVRPAMAVDAAGLAVAPADLERDVESIAVWSASQKQQPPMMSGSFGPMPAKPGTTSTTRAAACSGVVMVTGRVLGLGLAAWMLPPAQPTTMMATAASAMRLV